MRSDPCRAWRTLNECLAPTNDERSTRSYLSVTRLPGEINPNVMLRKAEEAIEHSEARSPEHSDGGQKLRLPRWSDPTGGGVGSRPIVFGVSHAEDILKR